MTRPMTGKADVVLEYPDKFYMGTFDHNDRFDARFEPNKVSLTLQRTGESGLCRSVRIHLQPRAFADLLGGLAVSGTMLSDADREALHSAARALYRAVAIPPGEAEAGKEELRPPRNEGNDDLTKLTPDEEVLLLHVME